MESILTSIKKLLGITEEYEHFDDDLIMHINSVFMVLNQLGVGPENGFAITSKADQWSSYISDPVKVAPVKTYMYQKVRLIFDPPASSSVIESYKQMIYEFEWRLNVAAESS